MSLNGAAASSPRKKRAATRARPPDDGELVQPLKKSRVDKRQYKVAWEQVPELQGWIMPVPGDPQRAYCRYCRISLRAHRRDLVDHSMTERHVRNGAQAVAAGGDVNGSDGVAVIEKNVKDEQSSAADFFGNDNFEFEGDLDQQLNEDGCSTSEAEPTRAAVSRNPTITALTRAVRQSQQQILVIQTGGTIDKDYPTGMCGSGFEVGESAAQRIFERVGLELSLVVRTICRKDSQELTSDDRFLIYECCANAPQQRILITHGNDALLETASYLSLFGDLSSRVIVLTASMKPESFKNSDADFNVGCALGALQVLPAPGVYVSMHGFVAKWDQVERDSVTNKFVKREAGGYF